MMPGRAQACAVDWDALVLCAGDRVSASGRLMRDYQGTWFEPPVPEPLIMFQDAPIRPPFRGAVRVTGADFDHVTDRHEQNGAVEGWATVSGTWSGGEIQVERQSSRLPAGPGDEPTRETPPCPPPPGGWPHGANGGDLGSLDFDLGDLTETGAAVSVVAFRPGRDQAVLVVAAADPDAVEARLRPQLGPRLCIVPSRWTRQQIDDARDYLHDRWDDWNLYQLGVMTSQDAQAIVSASLTRVLPEIAAWAASQPSGILRLDPWLVPLGAD
jgi:hypothetical protein